MAIEIRDDAKYTQPMPSGSWLVGGRSTTDAAPTAFSREAILAYIQANFSVGGANLMFDVGTLANVSTFTVPSDIFTTTGYAVDGDGGSATYIRVAAEPSHPGKVQDGGGAWFELVGNRVPVEAFGAVAYTQSELVALNGAASVDTQATSNTTAFANANAYIKAVGGGTILAPGPIYVLNGAVRRGQGVYIEGSGVGEWEPIYPQRPKTWEGTTLLFKGTGTADVTFPGITSMRNSGGWREDPSNPGSYFKLWSAYDNNATGTTPATALSFSVAVMPETDANYGGLRHLRICNWIGTDGITDWSNTGSSSLGDDWDFGYVLKNNEYADDENIQVVGGWREAAHAQIATTVANSVSERNSIRRAKFQGRRGMIIRAPDRWHVTATTSSTVTVYFSTESYWPTSGTFRGSDNVTYTYTGVTHVGADTAFTFTGVTPDPNAAGIFQVRHPSSGFGNSEYVDVYVYGLDHQSSSLASVLGYTDSKPLEISGFPLRGIKLNNCKFHTSEPVLVHMHDAQDITFDSYQVEGVAHVIASPVRTDATYASAAVGETRNITMLGGIGMSDQTLTLFLPRSGYVEELQVNPTADLTGDLALRPLRSGRAVVIEDASGTDFLRGETQSWTPSLRFVTVTHGTQTGTYIQMGKLVLFDINISWTGLDTADTSNFDISLPVAASTGNPVQARLIERTATGVNLSSLTAPYFDISAGGGLGLTHNRTTRVAYNTAGIFSAAGNMRICGQYWAD